MGYLIVIVLGGIWIGFGQDIIGWFQRRQHDQYVKDNQPRWDEEKRQAEEEYQNIVKSAVAEHKSTLLSKRQAIIDKNDYGALDADKWRRVMLNFYKTVMRPKLNGYPIDDRSFANRVIGFVEDLLDE
jgi:hypothetical protein|tara:strand:- start:54 stop:437 length:384 start_codon:yes stop_codon:yes gene_type:complete